MRPFAAFAFAAVFAAAFAVPASATGWMQCDSGPENGWKSKAELTEAISARGWRIRRIKIDGGCYEVYGTSPQGQRVEAYFHPVSLDLLLIARRGEILYRK